MSFVRAQEEQKFAILHDIPEKRAVGGASNQGVTTGETGEVGRPLLPRPGAEERGSNSHSLWS